MESAVEKSLAAHPRDAAGAEPPCWCPLCIADMRALALSSLPPAYVTRRAGSALASARAVAVSDEVARAVRHVGSHPKHPAGGGGATPEAVALVNYPFEVGFSLIEERLHSHAGACECWECRCDAVAFALNRFPPQYGVAVDGRSTFPESGLRLMADEMVTFLDLGVRIATSLPRHAADH